MNSPFKLLIWLAVAAVYFTPAIIAWTRHPPHRGWATIINVFAGWTVIGWAIALAMACRTRPQVRTGS
jgi:hypothetical protein